MSDYTFRPWHEGDDLELLQIWPSAESNSQALFRSTLKPDNDKAGAWSRTLVVEDQGIPVAAGSVYESTLHPEHLWAYLEVSPDHRRNGLGTELLAKLRELAAGAPSGISSLRTKVANGSVGAEFALASGLSTLQHSLTVQVEAGAIPIVPLRVDDNDEPNQAIEDIATGSVELTQKFWDFYQRSHRWDAPAEISLGRVNQLFLSESAEAYGAIVLRDQVQYAARVGQKAEMIAFAVSYRPMQADMPGFELAEDHATEVLLGYDFDQEGTHEAIMQLLSLLVAQYPVTLEITESMTALWEVAEQLIRMGAARVLEDTLILAG